MNVYSLDEETRISLFLATNRALLKRITPEIRAVSIDYDGKVVDFYVYSEKELGEEGKKEFDVAAQEIMAAIKDKIPVKVQFLVVPMPQDHPVVGKFFYHRKEKRMREAPPPEQIPLWGLDTISEETREQLLDETHRALFWRITPEIRAVSVDYDDGAIYLYVYSESELQEKDQEEFNCATTEIVSGIQEKKPIGVRFCVVPMSQEISIQGAPFFQRKEVEAKK